MPRPICLYHRNCLDGCGAVAVVAKCFPDIEAVPVQYGDEPPNVLDRDVFVVDVGFSLERMRALRAQAKRFTWIDHHLTNRPMASMLVGPGSTVVFDEQECGTSLTWRTLFPGVQPPRIIDYIRDKDLWQWSLPDSRAICAGLGKRFALSKWQGILDADLAEMARTGQGELARIAERAAAVLTRAEVRTGTYGLAGVRAALIACAGDQNEISELACAASELGGLGAQIAVLYYRKADGRWVHSLRSAAIDCQAIAAARGGGGHPQSAAYVSEYCITETVDAGRPIAADG